MKKNNDFLKQELFEYAKNKNLFWSYSKELQLSEVNDNLLIEKVLKYGDVSELKKLFLIFHKDLLIDVWGRFILFDEQFSKLNYYLSKLFFNIDISEIKKKYHKDKRIERLKLLTAQNC